MKVSQLGLKPGESPMEEPKGQQEEEEKTGRRRKYSFCQITCYRCSIQKLQSSKLQQYVYITRVSRVVP